MQKTTLLKGVLTLFVFFSAEANAYEVETLTPEIRQTLVRYTDHIFETEETDTVHKRLHAIEPLSALSPLRVYVRREGLFVHTYSDKNAEKGYFITPKSNAKPFEEPMLELHKVTDRIFTYVYKNFVE